MSISKLKKHVKGWTSVPNHILNSTFLSMEEKSLWGFINSKPEGWDFNAELISSQNKESPRRINNILQKLEDNNLLIRKKLKNEKGHFVGIEYTLYEFEKDCLKHKKELSIIPKPTDGQPSSGEPSDGGPLDGKSTNISNPEVSNPDLSKTKVSNTELSNTKKQTIEEVKKINIESIQQYTKKLIDNPKETETEWKSSNAKLKTMIYDHEVAIKPHFTL
jgi:hypothetical protein